MAYVDMENRGYLTAIGDVHFSNNIEDKKRYWTDRFSAFFPSGPESDEYTLMVFKPKRLELRSFGLDVAGEPTHWSPVVLERSKTGEWRQIN
jgi:general stress protein 26